MTGQLEGEWSLVYDGDTIEPERFTIRNDEVAPAGGKSSACVAYSHRSATISLPDGRTIAIVLPEKAPGLFSATVTSGSGDDRRSEPVVWRR